jgi:hypothetical protein
MKKNQGTCDLTWGLLGLLPRLVKKMLFQKPLFNFTQK